MFLFDPRAGTGANIRRLMLAEVTFNTTDILANAGDDMMADTFWQVAAMIAHPNS